MIALAVGAFGATPSPAPSPSVSPRAAVEPDKVREEQARQVQRHLLMEKARVFLKLERWKLSIENVDEVLEVDPEDIDAWRILAEAEEKLGHFHAATEGWEKVLALGKTKATKLSAAEKAAVERKLDELEDKMAAAQAEERLSRELMEARREHGFSLGYSPLFQHSLGTAVAKNALDSQIASGPLGEYINGDVALHLWGYLYIGYRHLRAKTPDASFYFAAHEPFLRVDFPVVRDVFGMDGMDVYVPAATSFNFVVLKTTELENGAYEARFYNGVSDEISAGAGLRYRLFQGLRLEVSLSYHLTIFAGPVQRASGVTDSNNPGTISWNRPLPDGGVETLPIRPKTDGLDFRVGFQAFLF